MSKKETILEAIEDLFGDNSDPARETLEALREIRDFVLEKIEMLKADMAR